MFGVPIDGPVDVLSDSMVIFNNTTLVNSKLHKEHNSLAYHAACWAVAAQILRIGKIHTQENITEALTKLITEAVHDYLLCNWTY